MRKNIIITGMPKSGKSTILKKIIINLDKKVGFVTNEVRKDGERIGFEIETHNGQKVILANTNFKTNYKVAKYYVNIENLDRIIPEVESFSEIDCLYLDEIAEMELFSENFKELVNKYLNSSNTCIFTLSKVYSNKFTEEILKRNDIILIEITEENREKKEIFIKLLLKKIEKAKRYISEQNRFTITSNKVNIVTDHGIRTLTKQKKDWSCSCDFFKENKICSHIIALEEYLNDNHKIELKAAFK